MNGLHTYQINVPTQDDILPGIVEHMSNDLLMARNPQGIMLAFESTHGEEPENAEVGVPFNANIYFEPSESPAGVGALVLDDIIDIGVFTLPLTQDDKDALDAAIGE